MQLSPAQMFHHRWCAALAAGDAATIRGMLHPDAVQVSATTGQVLTGAEQICGALEQLFAVAGPITTSGVESFVDLGDSFCVESVQSTTYAQALSYDIFVIDAGLVRSHTNGSVAPRSLSPLPPPTGPSQAQDLYRRYWAALSAQDPNALAALLAPDIRFCDAGDVLYGRDAVLAAMRRVWAGGIGTTLKTVSRFVETPYTLCTEATANVGGQGGRLDISYYETWILRHGQVPHQTQISHLVRGLINPRPAELKQIVQKMAAANTRAVQDWSQAFMMHNAMQVRW